MIDSAIMDMLRAVFGEQEVLYLFALIGANLVLGVLASLRNGDFMLTRLFDWLWQRVIPLAIGYGVAAMLAYVNPDLMALKVAAFGTATLTLLGYVLANLKDFGINIPESLGGK